MVNSEMMKGVKVLLSQPGVCQPPCAPARVWQLTCFGVDECAS
jgi:hypothetical protein